ncbi:MAG: MFS transporter [Clostridia bacterium]|nr:MFS transporter [Clostridia bacterium]
MERSAVPDPRTRSRRPSGEGASTLAQNVQTTNQITGERRWWALAAVMISMFFSSLNQTSVSTAMPTIISDLNGLHLYAWVFTAYILTSSVTVPLYGRLSDMYGRKPFYVFGLLVFVAGSALAGYAQSIGMLIAARAIQGIGGGAMLSMPRATIGDIFTPRERGRWMGLIMGIFGLASLVGPALGGWITDHLSWHWVFFINMPVAVAALAMVLYALPTVRTGVRHRVDWTGSVLLAGGLVPMLLGFTWGGTTYPWGSWQEIALFAGAAAILALFVWNERRAEEPVIQLEIFANPTFAATIVISLLVMMAMFSANMFLPLFVQGVLGISAQNAGFILTPMMLSFVAASIVAGQVMTRTGRYKVMAHIGGAVLVAGAFLMTRLSAGSTWGEVVRDMVLLGLGIGTLMPIMGTVIQNIFPYRMLGQVNATQQAVNTLAGAIAAPVLGTVMANRFAERLPRLLPDALKQWMARAPADQRAALGDPQGLVTAEAQAALHQKFAALGPQGETLYRGFIEAVRHALAAAMTELYVVALVVAVLAFFATFFLREVRLKHEEFFAEGRAGGGVRAEAARAEGAQTVSAD